MSEALDKHTCAACDTVRKANNLRYDPETFLPYCQHAEICSPAHPNSPTSILERGYGITLVTLQEAERLYKEKLLMEQPDAFTVAMIRKLLEKPVSMRVLSPDLAKYLVQVMKDYNMANMAETIRYLLTVAMESHSEFYLERKVVHEQQVKEKKVKEVFKEVAEPVKVDEPAIAVETPSEDTVSNPVDDTESKESEEWVF